MLTSTPPWNGEDSIESPLRFLLLSITGFSQLPFGLMPIRSYVRSTDIPSITRIFGGGIFPRQHCFAEYRVSHGKKVLCGIDIPVVVRPAIGAVPFTDTQW